MMNFLLSRSENIIASLDAFWKGMLGIFLVIGVLAVTVYFLNKAINKFQVRIDERKKLADKNKTVITEEENK